MKKTTKKIAIVLSAMLCIQPLMFSIDTQLNKDIVALELEITKMTTRVGEYADMSEKALEKKLNKAKKDLEKKKAKAKKEAEKDKKRLKKGIKNAGEDLKDAGKEIGNTFKEIFE